MPTKPVSRNRKIYKTLQYLGACLDALKWGSKQKSFQDMLNKCPEVCWFQWLVWELRNNHGTPILKDSRDFENYVRDNILYATAHFCISDFIARNWLMEPLCEALERVYHRATRNP